jgi:hypothetical protein
MLMDMQQRPRVLNRTARVALHTAATVLHHSAQYKQLFMRQICVFIKHTHSASDAHA